MTHFLPARLVPVVIFCVSLLACSSQNKALAPDPVASLQSVPPADSGKYERIADMRNWRNPYLVVGADGLALLDPSNSAEIVLKPDELLAALARLPASAWPYGRVVAVSEGGPRGSEPDNVAIRRNKGIVGGILAGAHVAVDWIPSA